MSLTKSTVIDQITISEEGTVYFREATRIMEDGVELTKSYHRSSLAPGQDLTGIPEQVIAYCNLAWTPEIIAAYEAEQARIAAERAAYEAEQLAKQQGA